MLAPHPPTGPFNSTFVQQRLTERRKGGGKKKSTRPKISITFTRCHRHPSRQTQSAGLCFDLVIVGLFGAELAGTCN